CAKDVRNYVSGYFEFW
nr:immunoglobulin heavy chain junction region [Macaca mulatta]MOV91484.1 immunoglobulin heavy chain junction region [Macaca mulatta]